MKMANNSVWCLRRCGSQSRKYALIPLPSGTEVTLGRGLDVTVQLLSKKNHQLMLSRKHAIFKEMDGGQWAVIDNKSLNGVHVNSTRITPLEPHALQNGDLVQLGVIAQGENQAEFVFMLTQESHSQEEVSQILESYKIPQNKGTAARADSHKDSQNSEHVVCRTSGSTDVLIQSRTGQEEKKRKLGTYPVTNSDRNDKAGPSSGLPSPKRTKLASASEQELSARLAEEKRLAERKAAEAEEQFKELSRMLAEQQSARELLEKQLKQRELDINRELESEKEELENKKKQLQEEMEKAVLLQVQQKEQVLQEQLQKQQDALAEEKQALEKKLKDEWEKRLQDQERQLKETQAEMKTTLEAQVQEKEAIMMEQLKSQREELLKEKQRVENSLQEEWSKKMEEKDKSLGQMQEELRVTLEEEIKKKEDMMLQQLQMQREALQNEKAKVEQSLQEELERKLEEKDKDLQAGLEKEKAKLEEVIANKEREYAELQTELTASRLEKEAQEVCIQKAKEEAMQNITDVMENELQCSVCAELFIKATTLNCSHSFCKYCIECWMKRKRECPVCRTPITSHSHSIVLDNYIDKMVERLSEEMKQRRQEIVEERKAGGVDAGPSAGNPPRAIDPIEISSEYDDSEIDHIEEVENSEEEEDEDDSEDSSGYGYYGDRCYACGRRGHWARRCPYR